MVVKKLIKNIEFKGIATLPNIAKVNYFGSYPIELNHNNNTFSFASDYTYTRQEIDNKINGIKPEGLDDIKTQITTNTNNIASNQQDIASINRDLEIIKQNESKDIHYVGEILSSSTYNANDYGYVGDKWYLCVASGSGDVSNKSNWKQTSAPSNKVDLSNYYTKLQTNNLLKPLETRLTSIEGLNTTQSQEISTIKQDIQRVEGLIPPQVDLTPYATKVELDNKINPLASKAQVKDLYDWIVGQGYLTSTSLNTLEGRVQTIEGNIPTWNAKLDASALNDYYTKQETNELLEPKQDKLVSNNEISINQDNTLSINNAYLNPKKFVQGQIIKNGSNRIELRDNKGNTLGGFFAYYLSGNWNTADGDYFGIENSIKIYNGGVSCLIGCRNMYQGKRRPIFAYMYGTSVFFVDANGDSIEIGDSAGLKFFYLKME